MAWAVELSTSGEAWASCRNFRRPKGNFFLDIPFIEPRLGTDPGSQLDHLVEASLSKGYQSSTLSWNVLTPSALDARLEPGLLPLIRSTEHSITDRCCHSPVAVRGTARSLQLEHLVVFRLRTQNGSVCLHTHVHS